MALYNALQGNLGLGKAIEYFTSQSIPVAIPLNDTQKYDIIADLLLILSNEIFDPKNEGRSKSSPIMQ